MFNKNVFKEALKTNYKLWIAVTVILCFFMTIICVVVGGGVDLPVEGAGDAFGGINIMSLLSMGFFGMIGFILPLVYIISVGNSLVAGQVDKGSMAYTLSTPTSRLEVTITKMIFLIVSIIAMYLLVFIVSRIGFAISDIEFPTKDMALLVLGITLLQLAIAGIMFMCSCIFNTSGKAITFGAGIPILSFVFNTLGQYSTQYDFFKIFKYLSLNSLYNTTDILAGEASIIISFIVLALISIATFTIGHLVFKKKDLPL